MLTHVARPPATEQSAATKTPGSTTERTRSAESADAIANTQRHRHQDTGSKRLTMPEPNPLSSPNDADLTDADLTNDANAVTEKDLVQIFKLLADETRLKILMSLQREGELHVSALCDRLGQSQPAVSHHLALLRDAGLIYPRRDGKHNYYSVRREHFETVMNGLFDSMLDRVPPTVAV